MSQQVRYIVFIATSVVILILWNTFVAPRQPPRPPVTMTADAGTADAGGGLAEAPSTLTPGSAQPPGAPPADDAPAVPLEEATFETEKWQAVFTSEGGALARFELKGEKNLTRPEKGERKPVNLAHARPSMPPPLSIDVVGLPGFKPADRYRVAAKTGRSITFERTSAGVTISKTFSWSDDSPYGLALAVGAAREDGTAAPLPLRLHYSAFEPPTGKSSGLLNLGPTAEVHQAICHLAGAGRSIENHTHDSDKPEVRIEGKAGYAGLDEKYFLTAIAPVGEADATCVLRSEHDGELEAILERPLVPGGKASFEVYLGPKDSTLLAAAGHDLHTAIDFGFTAIIGEVLLKVLKIFEKGVGNWGIAIILLTLLVKALTFPLTHRQMKSMEEMRRLNPKLEELKAKYAGDQQRIQAETMKLWKEHKVSPLGGCLPMLVQMPVWFALYATLSISFELYNEPFIAGWISDLTSKDPYYVTPVLMTVTMFLSQILTPQQAMNQQMKFMTYGMPLIFGFFMLNLPAGLVLYIFTNSLLSIVQSLWFRRTFGQAAAVKA